MLSNPRTWMLPAVLLASLPVAARADNLGGLVYVVVIWPIGALLCISLIILSIIAAVKRRRKRFTRGSRTFGIWATGVAIAEAAIFPFVVAGLDASFGARGNVEALLVSVLPVLLASAVCIVLAIRLVRRCVDASSAS
jgi:hypothetical protein